ncbi:MAG TPA: PspC domain-containing protein [Acidimicrobiia bacterium]|nr:PspC domain-containing protein [Acidimicrobiia bacterium]
MDRSFDLYRRRSNRIAAGVAGGVADTLRVHDTFVRAAFVSLSMIWGLGFFLYIILWLVSFDDVDDREVEMVDGQQGIGLGMAFLGFLLLLRVFGWWPDDALVWIVTAISFGVAALTDRSLPSPLTSLLDPGVEQPGRVRILIGVSLLVGGLAFMASTIGPVAELGAVLLAVALTGLGLLVAFGPWVRRLAQDLGHERRERIRQEERAEMAAHLHDSVLQTLALIQRSDDPVRMGLLARHQEGELRDWLYGNMPLDGVDLVSTALRGIASKVEQDHQVPVDVVTVGDITLDESLRPLLGAVNEAMVNAAKHSGADRVSAYMEVGHETLEIFVTDQGKGFDPANVGSDRKGIENSIIARAEKAGAKVSIESEPGEGTEVLIRMKLEGT